MCWISRKALDSSAFICILVTMKRYIWILLLLTACVRPRSGEAPVNISAFVGTWYLTETRWATDTIHYPLPARYEFTDNELHIYKVNAPARVFGFQFVGDSIQVDHLNNTYSIDLYQKYMLLRTPDMGDTLELYLLR